VSSDYILGGTLEVSCRIFRFIIGFWLVRYGINVRSTVFVLAPMTSTRQSSLKLSEAMGNSRSIRNAKHIITKTMHGNSPNSRRSYVVIVQSRAGPRISFLKAMVRYSTINATVTTTHQRYEQRAIPPAYITNRVKQISRKQRCSKFAITIRQTGFLVCRNSIH